MWTPTTARATTRQTALSERPDRCGMGAYRAADPAGQARRRQTARRYPRGDQRRDVHSEHRLPVARAAQAPPRSTVHDYLGLWNPGTLDRIHHALYLKCREKAAREASPACIIDSQSVKSAEKGGSHRLHGFDAGKLIKGKAACSGRYARLAAARHRHRRRRSGSRRRSRAAGDLVRSVSLSREIVRRQRLSGPGLSPRPGRHPARSRDRDRQAIRSGEALRRPAQALGGRTHHCVPPTGQGLGVERARLIKLASIRLMLRKLNAYIKSPDGP